MSITIKVLKKKTVSAVAKPIINEDELTEIVEDSMLMPYLNDETELEWLKANATVVMDECKEKNIQPTTFKSFRWKKRQIPKSEPTKHREKVAWWIDTYRIYNERLMVHYKWKQIREEKERKEFDKKVYSGLGEFWDGLRICNPTIYKQFRDNYETNKYIQEEVDKLEREFVYDYVYFDINPFEKQINE